jgi:hypothetical protein
MSKLDDKIELYTKSANDLNLGLDSNFIAAVTKGLGPSIYNKDAESVSCSDSSELETVKKNFLIKKLGLEDSDKLDDAIKAVCQKMGSSNRNKYRALFYALLAKEFSKESIYA